MYFNLLLLMMLLLLYYHICHESIERKIHSIEEKRKAAGCGKSWGWGYGLSLTYFILGTSNNELLLIAEAGLAYFCL